MDKRKVVKCDVGAVQRSRVPGSLTNKNVDTPHLQPGSRGEVEC